MTANGVKEAKKQKNQDTAVTEMATQPAAEKSATKQPCGCCGERKEIGAP